MLSILLNLYLTQKINFHGPSSYPSTGGHTTLTFRDLSWCKCITYATENHFFFFAFRSEIVSDLNCGAFFISISRISCVSSLCQCFFPCHSAVHSFVCESIHLSVCLTLHSSSNLSFSWFLLLWQLHRMEKS